MTAWFVVGIWKYGSERQDSLEELIATQKIRGNISVVWDRDLCRAWPQLQRSAGWRFDDTSWMNYAIEYLGGNTIGVASSHEDTIIEYDLQAGRWILHRRQVSAKPSQVDSSRTKD
jgi:hypothetical protein